MVMAMAVLTALALAACGEDEGASPTATASGATKAEFVAAANRICAKASARLESAGRSFFAPAPSGEVPTEREFVEERVVPILGGQLIDGIAALQAPPGDEATVAAIVDAGRRGLAALRSDPESIKAEPGSAGDPLREFGDLGRAYGLRCSDG